MKEQQDLRLTIQRKIILEELRKMHDHPTADVIYERVRKRIPNISLGTVYRNLELLSSRGIIRRVDIAGRKRRYDAKTTEHAHIRCAICGRIVDVPGYENIRKLAHEISLATGFTLILSEAEFVGICPECRSREVSHSGLSRVDVVHGNLSSGVRSQNDDRIDKLNEAEAGKNAYRKKE